MIEILNTYYTKEGKKIVVLDYSNGRYLCSYSDGSKVYLYKEEILMTEKTKKVVEPIYEEEQNFHVSDDFIKLKNKTPVGIAKNASTISFEERDRGDFDLNLMPEETEKIEGRKNIFLKPEETEILHKNKSVEIDDLYEDL